MDVGKVLWNGGYNKGLFYQTIVIPVKCKLTLFNLHFIPFSSVNKFGGITNADHYTVRFIKPFPKFGL